MIRVFPIKVIRPEPETVLQVSTRIGGSESIEHLTEELESNPFSYLHVVKPYIHFADPEHQERHFPFGRNYFRQLKAQGVLVNEPTRRAYIYRQTDAKQGRVYEGYILGVSVLDYDEDKIKRHEHTLTSKENKLVKHIETLGAIGEPMLLCHLGGPGAEMLEQVRGEQLFDFVTEEDGLRHEVWYIPEEKWAALAAKFSELESLYIADGHHRIAATARYLDQRLEAGFAEEDCVLMAYVLPADQLQIKPFHRLVKSMPVFDDWQLWIRRLEKGFSVASSAEPVFGVEPGVFGMYSKDHGWYLLRLREENRPAVLPKALDVACLESLIFKDILGIEDSKTSEDLSFVRGDMTARELESLVASKFAVAFTVHPNSFKEIKDVADRHGVMPPKSTWIEPKLRTGMIIQEF